MYANPRFAYTRMSRSSKPPALSPFPLRPTPPLLRLGIGLCLLAAAGPNRADSLRLPNGEQLEGTIVQETTEVVLFRSRSFGELRVARQPGLILTRSGGTALQVTTATAVPPAAPPAPPPPAPGWVQRALGLGERWSVELEASLLLLGAEHRVRSQAIEGTLGHRIPSAQNPAQPRHEFGLFGSHSFQEVDQIRVEEKSELAFRYFFHSTARWIIVSQADWQRDRINSVESCANAIAVPAAKLIDRPATRFLLGIGPSYRAESRLTTGPARTTVVKGQRTVRVAVYQVFNHKFTPRLTCRETLLVLARPGEAATRSLRLQVSLRRQLTEHLSVNLNFEGVRDENEVFLEQSTNTLKLTAGYNF